MIDFQKKRDILIKQFDWSRRVATLAVRIVEGVESFDDIAKTPSFHGKPLLSVKEIEAVAQLVEQWTFNP